MFIILSATADQYAQHDSCYSAYYHSVAESFSFLLSFILGLLNLPFSFVPVHPAVPAVTIDPAVVIAVHTVILCLALALVLSLALAVVIIITVAAVIIAIIP